MTFKIDRKIRRVVKNRLTAALFLVVLGLFAAVSAIRAQAPSPSPVPSPSPSPKPADTPYSINGFEITSTIELGVRGLDVNGSDNKFRSDFNYKPGFRVFDSSFLIENKEKKGRFFDSLLVTASGWNADPTGFFRLNAEKTGAYRFDSTVRGVKYFNNLANHALNEHNASTEHNFGNMDLLVFPESPDLRLRLGFSFNKTDGTGGFTTRAYSDEFPVSSDVNTGSWDGRGGFDETLFGFNLSLMVGYRHFAGDTSYSLLAPNAGNNPANTARLTTFQRNYPIHGSTAYSTFSAQRTFAKKLDFTGRFIYSSTITGFKLFEIQTGRDNSNNIVDLDRFEASGKSTRPQSRGDIGLTYLVNRSFRISESFTYDHFNISGGNGFFEALNRRNNAGNPLAVTLTRTASHRITAYRRFQNTIEADYQVNNILGFNIGYRFGTRRVVLQGSDRNLITPAAAPALVDEEFDNQTHTLIAGTIIKPVKHWVIFADVEHGDADNAFTRLSNYKYTNFRVRTRATIKQFSLNLSVITKDNDNPSFSTVVPIRDFTANIKNRTFSGSVDWSPVEKFSFSAGYTYQNLTSEVDINVPVGGVITPGVSQFYMRDGYAFFDVTAQPIRRVSIFASYRYNKDDGQGNRVSILPQNIITSYPFKLQTPEVRLAIRLTDHIDWNLGYQYYDYREALFFNQNYSAHLPYTSLKIYFGGADRR
jgi:hypothetical protein